MLKGFVKDWPTSVQAKKLFKVRNEKNNYNLRNK